MSVRGNFLRKAFFACVSVFGAGWRRGVIYHVPPISLGPLRGIGGIMCFCGGMRSVMRHAPTADARRRSLDKNVIPKGRIGVWGYLFMKKVVYSSSYFRATLIKS